MKVYCVEYNCNDENNTGHTRWEMHVANSLEDVHKEIKDKSKYTDIKFSSDYLSYEMVNVLEKALCLLGNTENTEEKTKKLLANFSGKIKKLK